MSLQNTPSSERLHIGFFGLRNAGKSSVVNAVTNQNLSLVSDILGTTTDPVKKAMELLPLGPVVIIDTPGLDDEGALGEMRVKKAKEVLAYTDIAVLVVDAKKGKSELDYNLIETFKERKLPFIVVYNKMDLLTEKATLFDNEIYVSAINEENIDRFLRMVDDEYNCLTLCSGSLNADPSNNVAEIVRKHCDRIAFAHIRNVKHFPNGDFSEASHRDCDGDTGILEILKAYHDSGFEGYIRPDHGRHLWDEGPGNVRPGYGLYDRALGIMYMLGVWDSLEKFDKK